MKYKCVIFDCDGTLVDTLGDISGAMNQALAAHGYPQPPAEKYRDMVGWGVYRLARLALPKDAQTDDVITAVAADAQKLMQQQAAAGGLSRPYPGIKELLAELRSKKITMAVLSNKPEPVLRRLMDALFLPGAFDAVYGLRPDTAAKPDPGAVWDLLAETGKSPRDAVFVGDSEIDMETAVNSGCYPLGVSWGFRSRAVLEAAGAARIIDRPEQVLDIINGK